MHKTKSRNLNELEDKDSIFFSEESLIYCFFKTLEVISTVYLKEDIAIFPSELSIEK